MAHDASLNEVLDAVWQFLSRRMSDRAVAATELVEDLMTAHGRITRREQELRAGEHVLNDDRDLLGRASRATSLGLSLYLGNRRIASFAVLDGGSAHELGGFADAVLVDTVLRKRETFRGVLEYQGRPHLVACKPLFPTDAPEDYGAIGMIEAYQDLGTFRELLEASLRDNLSAHGQSATEQQADRMEAVMHFIDDVARRLQLLALNGNIIAAQAGDHGRAFRVVCRELSNLADQSKEAVAEVRRLTQEMGLADSSATDHDDDDELPFDESQGEPASYEEDDDADDEELEAP